METAIAIKIPKNFVLEGASVLQLKNGKIFLRSQGVLYPVSEFPLEIPKYIIGEGEPLCKATRKGVIKVNAHLHAKDPA
ncbi:hypothetical protein NEDG_00471 [Nematocida displodere]|uniref:Uncharacterized protein n=1 Tax=Nematocida displodere TaxID=1805483 RepID=A0A177EJX4_9MICR|nr:hypothetical protein NEDG_00471 [Nematocida displodere]